MLLALLKIDENRFEGTFSASGFHTTNLPMKLHEIVNILILLILT
jgi:hypothetical protein